MSHQRKYEGVEISHCGQTIREPIRPLAVFIGWLFGVIVSLLLGFTLVLVAANNHKKLTLSGLPANDVAERSIEMEHWYNILDVLRWICAAVVGGSAAAWVGPQRPLAHGVAVGIALLVTSAVLTVMILLLFFSGQWPSWAAPIGLLATIPASATGGYVRGLHAEKIQGS